MHRNFLKPGLKTLPISKLAIAAHLGDRGAFNGMGAETIIFADGVMPQPEPDIQPETDALNNQDAINLVRAQIQIDVLNEHPDWDREARDELVEERMAAYLADVNGEPSIDSQVEPSVSEVNNRGTTVSDEGTLFTVADVGAFDEREGAERIEVFADLLPPADAPETTTSNDGQSVETGAMSPSFIENIASNPGVYAAVAGIAQVLTGNNNGFGNIAAGMVDIAAQHIGTSGPDSSPVDQAAVAARNTGAGVAM
jgi:hypothetical protein